MEENKNLKKERLGKIIMIILLVGIIISIFVLIILKIISNINDNDKSNSSNNNIISYDVNSSLKLSDMTNFIAGYKSYEDEYGVIKISLDNLKKIQYKSSEENFIINEIENVKSFLVHENTYESEYLVLTDNGELYISNGIPLESYNSYKENYFRKVGIDNVIFTDIYSIKQYKFFTTPINTEELFNSNLFVVKGDDNKFYIINEDNKYYDIINSKSYDSLNDVTEEINHNTVGDVIFRLNDYGTILLGKDGKLKLFRDGYFFVNKFVLPDNSEAKVYKLLIEPAGAYVYDLYALSTENKLYLFESPRNDITISTELQFKEVNNGKTVKSISYEKYTSSTINDDNVFKNITFKFEDGSEYIIDEIDNEEYLFNIEVPK